MVCGVVRGGFDVSIHTVMQAAAGSAISDQPKSRNGTPANAQLRVGKLTERCRRETYSAAQLGRSPPRQREAFLQLAEGCTRACRSAAPARSKSLAQRVLHGATTRTSPRTLPSSYQFTWRRRSPSLMLLCIENTVADRGFFVDRQSDG